ncbi:hypothetical protein [Gillisia hiemivivida]|uniref:Uncharacterized protein n=1 Tax=Gillisia hiemivivida TaxID=291190 RepID=A0A5C6ZTW1_9FLAO|nr:hypothetical protein [Gillisia hiemivivida]TXD94253.1 hypothetical protein ES724_06280 [Gillisia hiemivivida]
MNEKLLPNSLRKIVLAILLFLIIGLVFSDPIADYINLEVIRLNWILKDFILLSLIVFVFSKEKIETPRIQKIRAKKLIESLGFGVVVVIFDSLSAIFYSGDSFEMKSSYEFLILIFSYYLLSFYISKNIKEVAKA